MEPEGSLPHSQVSATCHYPEPARSSPYPPHPTSWRLILILSSNLRLGLPSGLFPSGFPTKTLYTPLLSPIWRSLRSSLCSFLHSLVTLSLSGRNILLSALRMLILFCCVQKILFPIDDFRFLFHRKNYIPLFLLCTPVPPIFLHTHWI